MNNLLSSIIKIGNKYNINKIMLFGSRARKDNTNKSDYDIAFISSAITLDLKNKIINELEELDTLHKIDAVFLQNLNGDDELTKNILKDGIMLMSKFEIKFNNFKNAYARLAEAISDFDKLHIFSVRDGAIQRFEFTTELAWKTVREYLLEQGVSDINTPKAVMSEAFSYNLIDDEQGWIQILNDRNSTSHIYDENEANEIFDRIKNNHLILFKNLFNKLS